MAKETRADALLLAGDPRCFAMGNPPMALRCYQALHYSDRVDRIAVVAPKAHWPLFEPLGAPILVEPGQNVLESVHAGVVALGSARRVLALCADLPLCMAKRVDDFLADCPADEATAVYGYGRNCEIMQRFPGANKRKLLVDGLYLTGGGIALFPPGLETVPVLRELMVNRKNIKALIWTVLCHLGWRGIYLVPIVWYKAKRNRLTLRLIERVVSIALRCKTVGCRVPLELAWDQDKPEEDTAA